MNSRRTGRWIERRTSARTAIILACLLLAAAPTLAQRGTGRMQGTVTDPEGNPLEGVQVTAYNPELVPSTLTAVTDENGNWAIMGFARADWKFTFELAGYIPHEVDASVGGGRNPNMDITLEPAADMGAMGGGASVGGNVASRELFDEGNALFEAGDYQGAIAKWQEFIELNPELPQVWFNVGNAHRELDNVAEARAAYEKVLAAEPADSRANYALGELLIEEENVEEAIPYFETALEGAPDDPALHYNVGELYFSQPGGAAKAIQFYESALTVDPNYLPAIKQLGFANLNAGNNEAAIAAFERYIEVAPPDDEELALVKDVLAALQGGGS